MGGYPSAVQGLRPINPLDGLQQASQIQGQDLANQSQQMANQQQAQQAKDLQTTMQVLQKYNGNMDQALPELASKVSPPTYMRYAQFHTEQKKATAEINDKELAIQKFKTEQLGGMISQAQALPDDQYLQAWPLIVQKAHLLEPDLELDPNQPIPKE